MLRALKMGMYHFRMGSRNYKQAERDFERAKDILEERKGFETSSMMVWINYGLAVVQREVHKNMKEARILSKSGLDMGRPLFPDVNGKKPRFVRQLEVFDEELTYVKI